MSYQGKKIISVTPAGRKEYIRILYKYLLANRDIIDEHHWWLNTLNQEDIEEIEMLCDEYPDFFKIIRSETPPDPDIIYKSIYKFFKHCQEPNTVYIRFDDDVLWIDKDAVRNLVEAKLRYPQHLFVSANVINNAICSHIHERMGLFEFIPSHIDGRKFGYDCFDQYGWASGPSAYRVHENFFKAKTNNDMQKYKFNLWILWERVRFSINTICFTGEDMSSIGGEINPEEEQYISSTLPHILNRYNSICGNALVSHFSFGPQLQFLKQTNLLDTYNRLADVELTKKLTDFSYAH